MKTPSIIIALALLSGCATKPQYQGFQTGRDYYATLSDSQKKVFDAAAEFAVNDQIQREYDVQRRAMRYNLVGAPKDTVLNKKLVPVLVQEHQGPDGVKHDASYKVIEVNSVQ